MRRARCAKTTGTGSLGAAPPRHAISDVVRGPLPAMHVGFWPAITRRQSPPSPLARQTSLAAVECGLWLGARDPEARRHYWKGYSARRNEARGLRLAACRGVPVERASGRRPVEPANELAVLGLDPLL